MHAVHAAFGSDLRRFPGPPPQFPLRVLLWDFSACRGVSSSHQLDSLSPGCIDGKRLELRQWSSLWGTSQGLVTLAHVLSPTGRKDTAIPVSLGGYHGVTTPTLCCQDLLTWLPWSPPRSLFVLFFFCNFIRGYAITVTRIPSFLFLKHKCENFFLKHKFENFELHSYFLNLLVFFLIKFFTLFFIRSNKLLVKMRRSSGVASKSSLISALRGQSLYGWSASSIVAVSSLLRSSRLLVATLLLETDGENTKSCVLFCFSSTGNSMGLIRGSTCLKYRYRSPTFFIKEGDCRHCFKTGLPLILAISCLLVSSWLFLIGDSNTSSMAACSCAVEGSESSEDSSCSVSEGAGLFLVCVVFSFICMAAFAAPSVRLYLTYHFLAVLSEWHIRRRSSSSSISSPCCFFVCMVVTIHFLKSVAVICVLDRTPLLTVKEEIRLPIVPGTNGWPSDIRKIRLEGVLSLVTTGLTLSRKTSIINTVSSSRASGAGQSSSLLWAVTSMILCF